MRACGEEQGHSHRRRESWFRPCAELSADSSTLILRSGTGVVVPKRPLLLSEKRPGRVACRHAGGEQSASTAGSSWPRKAAFECSPRGMARGREAARGLLGLWQLSERGQQPLRGRWWGCGLVPCRFGGCPDIGGGARGLACGHGPGSPVCWCCACSVGNRWECCGAAAVRRAGGAARCAAADACFGGSEARRRRFRGRRSGAIHTPPGSVGVCVGAMAAVFLASACDLRSVRRVARDSADAEQRQRPGEARQ